MKVAILGCGPAGLLAALAVEQSGNNPVILSKKIKSQIFGAQYLHREIPGITNIVPDHIIQVTKVGCAEGYAVNVYNDASAATSWWKFDEGPVFGWNMQKAYDALWDHFDDRICEANMTPEILSIIRENYPIVFSTIPLNLICNNKSEHIFRAQPMYIAHGPGHLIEGVNDQDMMYYNGYTPDGTYGGVKGFDWYRFSQIGGYQSWEYRDYPRQLAASLSMSRGFKPIATNCDCWPNLIKVGRFGSWDKQVLTHHVYERVRNEMLGLFANR